MTQNLVSYWNALEAKRSNLANEAEAKRHNYAQEAISAANVAEVRRHNVATEALTGQQLMETNRTNVANEEIRTVQAAAQSSQAATSERMADITSFHYQNQDSAKFQEIDQNSYKVGSGFVSDLINSGISLGSALLRVAGTGGYQGKYLKAK